MINQDDQWREQVIAAYGPELAEGAADRIKAAQPTLWNSPPGAFDQKLADLLASPAGARLKNPKFEPPDGETALERTLKRLPITPEALAVIARTKQLDWGHLPDGLRARLASELVRRPESSNMLAVPPPPSAAEERVAGALSTHFGELDYRRRQEMAKAWAFEFGGIRDEHALVERIAQRLTLPAAAARHGVEPLPRDDARLHSKAKAMAVRPEVPARGEDGRFVVEKVYKASPL
jgi:hypothetical protein